MANRFSRYGILEKPWSVPGFQARQRFRVREVRAVRPDGEKMVFSEAYGHAVLFRPFTRVSEVLAQAVSCPIPDVAVEFVTPLRLKLGNDLLRAPPPLDVLLHRVIGRAAQLAGCSLSPEHETLFEVARAARIAHHDIRWIDWSRYSARQRRSMPFGGLVGSVRYEGEGLQAIIPWLRLAEWLHAGNKSTFGLGVCRLIEPCRVMAA